MAESKRNGVLVQAGILAAASMIVRIIGLLYRAPLTAIIGDEGNGYYGTAYNIYSIILMVSSYSVPSAVSKLMAQKLAVGERRNAQRIFRCALIYGLIVGLAASLLLFFGAGLLVPAVAENVLRVFGPTVFLFGILAALRGYFQAHGSMVQTSISQILEQLANAIVSIGAAWALMRLAAGEDATRQAQMGAAGSALGTGSGVLIALIFMYLCYHRYTRRNADLIAVDTSGRLDGYGRIMKETILVITPFMLSGFILNLTTSLNQTIFYRIMIQVRSMDEIAATTAYGIFSNKAVVISNIPISIATAVSSAIIPGISAAFAKGDLEETRTRVASASRITALIAIPAFVGLAVLAKPITMLMFPQMESLDLAGSLLALLAITVVFYSISTITNAALQSIGRMNMPLVSAGIALIIQTIVLVGLLFIFPVEQAVYTLVFVSVLYALMIFVVNELFLRKYLGLQRDYVALFVKPLLCAVVMGAAAFAVNAAFRAIFLHVLHMDRAYFVNLFAVLPALVVAIAVYFILLIRTGTMTRENLTSLPRGEKLVKILTRLHWMK
jgi:stage V sporulation protein B